MSFDSFSPLSGLYFLASLLVWSFFYYKFYLVWVLDSFVFPSYWGRTFFVVLYPSELWGFAFCLLGTDTTPLCKLWLLFPVMLSEVFPNGFKKFPYMHMLIRALVDAWGEPSAPLQSSLSMQLSPGWYSALWTLTSLSSPDSQLHLLNSGTPLNCVDTLFCNPAWKLSRQ